METVELLEQSAESMPADYTLLQEISGKLDTVNSLAGLVVDCLIILVVLIFVITLAKLLDRFLFSHI